MVTRNALQAELESSMMERSECLQQLQELQKSEREAAAEALKHRQSLEMANTEKKALADRVVMLEADNAKLSAENVQVCLPQPRIAPYQLRCVPCIDAQNVPRMSSW
jgi:hypothetical protein